MGRPGLMNFRWLLQGRIAGADLPGHHVALEDDFAYLVQQGIRHLVTLTRQPLGKPPGELPLTLHHLPVPDMGVPAVRDAAKLCFELVERLQQGEPVVFHCRAGLGRTGTLAACCLMTLAVDAERGARYATAEGAITTIRSVNHYYIQSDQQEAFVAYYHQFLQRAWVDRSLLEASSVASGLPKMRLPEIGS